MFRPLSLFGTKKQRKLLISWRPFFPSQLSTFGPLRIAMGQPCLSWTCTEDARNHMWCNAPVITAPNTVTATTRYYSYYLYCYSCSSLIAPSFSEALFYRILHFSGNFFKREILIFQQIKLPLPPIKLTDIFVVFPQTQIVNESNLIHCLHNVWFMLRSLSSQTPKDHFLILLGHKRPLGLVHKWV